MEKERREREATYKKQLAKGAIIDLEEEKDKYKLTFAADDKGDEYGGGGVGGRSRNARSSPLESKDVSPSAARLDEPHRSEKERRGAVGRHHHRRRRGDGRDGRDGHKTHKHFQEKVVFHKPRETDEMSEMSEMRNGISGMRNDRVEARDGNDEPAEKVGPVTLNSLPAFIGSSADAPSVPDTPSVPDAPLEPVVPPPLAETRLSLPQLVPELSSSSSAKSDVAIEEAEPLNKCANSREDANPHVDDERTAPSIPHPHVDDERTAPSIPHPNHFSERPGSRGRGRGGGWGRGRGDGGGWRGGRGGRGRERGGRGARGNRVGSGGAGGYGKDHRNDDISS